MIGRAVEIVSEKSRGIFTNRAKRNRVKPRNRRKPFESAQFRALADSFVLGCIGDYDVAVS